MPRSRPRRRAGGGGSGTSTLSATCYARDAAEATAGCTTSDPTLVQVALALNGDDFFEFHFQSTMLGNVCTTFNVGKYSSYEPK